MNKKIDHMFTMSRLLVVAGKGGVGKTTVTAVLARASADAGLRVLVVTLDSRPGLAELLGGSPSDGVDDHGTMLQNHLGPTKTGSIQMRTVTAGEALQDYLATQGLALLAKRLVSSGVVGVVASAAPGIDDLLVLGKLKHLVGLTGPHGAHDLIIVDGPAAGHAISFLQAPAAMAQTISGGPLRSQAIEVRSMLQDPTKCRVVMVTSPETTPVNELIETTAKLRQSVGVAFAPVIVNGVDISLEVSSLVASGEIPDGVLGDAMRYRSTRSAVHLQAIARVHEHMAVGSFALPHIATASLQAHDVVTLADFMRKAVGEPA